MTPPTNNPHTKKYSKAGSAALRLELQAPMMEVYAEVGRTVSQREFIRIVQKRVGKGCYQTMVNTYHKILRENA